MKKVNFIALSHEEFNKISNLPEKELDENPIMKEKEIAPDMGDVIISLSGELYMMTTDRHDFGTLLLSATIVERHG
jgi:hypothetical protein